MRCVFAFAVFLFASHSVAVPVVNVRLIQAASPSLKVSAEIAQLEASRGEAEAAGLRRLDDAFNAALADAGVRMKASRSAGTMGAAAFLSHAAASEGPEHVHLLLRLLPRAPVSNRVQKRIAALERVRSADEETLIDQGCRELGLLVDIVASEAQAHVGVPPMHSRGVGFLESKAVASEGVDVRLLPPNEPFATVAGLVAAMERRRDTAEDKLRQHIADLELKLLQRMNAMIPAAAK